ncbi:hypothetical protein LCGC14_0628140 [marine sediment metagenome]|uniref:Uncharacterized protein n=1 Tax=marine sediment metagenome TaxID=412755 RepID=A0A0F9R7X7_9ZZZZ
MANRNAIPASLVTLQSSGVKSAVFNSEFTMDSSSAEAIEVFVDVTVAGTTMTLIIEVAADGTNFVTSKTFTAITATGTFALALQRGVDLMGKSLRIRASTVTGSFTLSILAVRKEG